MEVIELQELLQKSIDYYKSVMLMSYVILFIGIVGITFTVIIIFNAFLSKRFTKQNMRIWIAITCFVVIVLCLNKPFQAAMRNQIMLNNLRADLKNPSVVAASGKVEECYGYTKGGIAVIIGGETYYLSPQLSSMQAGDEYTFRYLSHSKSLFTYELLDDAEIPKSAEVTHDMLTRFNYESKGITTNYDAEDAAFAYVNQYYLSLGSDIYQKFLDTGWTVSGYYIQTEEVYRCRLISRNDTTRIYIVLDAKTSCPIYFWQDGDNL